jgi:hypothetical protein
MSEETFRWVVAAGVMLAAAGCIVGGIVSIVLLSVAKKIKDKLEPTLDAVAPLTVDSRELMTALKPRILKISAQAAEIGQLAVVEAHRYSEVSKDLAERAKAQIARLDGAVDNTVEHVHEAGDAVKSAVLRPMREIDGVFTGLRTAIATYRRGGRRGNVYSATQDEEMFI